MRVTDKTLRQVALMIHPTLRPIIERERMITDNDLRQAIKTTANLPSRPVSQRSLALIAECVCELG